MRHACDALPDGAAALALAEKVNYDLLLADIVMPELDGIELARRVSRMQPGLGHVHHRVRGGSAARQIADADRPRVLAKPFHLRHLIEEVEQLLTE